MRFLVVLLILTLGMQTSFAKKVKLFGQHITYANTQIEVFCYEDAFSKTEKHLGVIQFDEEGQFSMEFELDRTQVVFLPLGLYRAYFFAETGRTYHLSLPPKRDFPLALKSDPFFQPEDFLLGIKDTDKDDLNNLIRRFDNQFENFINQNLEGIYNQHSLSLGVTFSKEIEEEYADVKHPYFQIYLQYRLGYLEYLANTEAYITLENKYFAKKELHLNNLAYTILFDKIYNNALASAFYRREKTKFSRALESNEVYQELDKLMRTYSAYEDKKFRELLLAKSIFDGAENKLFSCQKAIRILEQINHNVQDEEIRVLIENYLNQLSHLLKNTKAPDFKVGDFTLENYKGKYLYLHFCNTLSPVWKNDLELLNKLYEAFGRDIEFLSLLSEVDSTGLNQVDMKWNRVQIDEENSVLKDYKIKVSPTYILINPEGKVYQYPARGPHDGIEKVFIKIQQDLLRKD